MNDGVNKGTVSTKRGLLIIVVGVIIFAVGLLATGVLDYRVEPQVAAPAAQNERKSEEPNEPEPLNLELQQTALGLEFTNNDSEAYEQCAIEVNYSTFGSGWKTKATLMPGQPTVVPFSSMTKSDGERFDISKYKVENVIVNMCVNKDNRFSTFEPKI